jgi:hypothetical protein
MLARKRPLFGRINSLFGRLGNWLEFCRNGNELRTRNGAAKAARSGFPGIFPLIRDEA